MSEADGCMNAILGMVLAVVISCYVTLGMLSGWPPWNKEGVYDSIQDIACERAICYSPTPENGDKP